MKSRCRRLSSSSTTRWSTRRSWNSFATIKISSPPTSTFRTCFRSAKVRSSRTKLWMLPSCTWSRASPPHKALRWINVPSTPTRWCSYYFAGEIGRKISRNLLAIIRLTYSDLSRIVMIWVSATLIKRRSLYIPVCIIPSLAKRHKYVTQCDMIGTYTARLLEGKRHSNVN